MKRLIARLRREYESPDLLQIDWQFFKGLFESRHEFWIEFCNTRWLVSILNTYVDHADPPENTNAMIALLPASWELMVQNRMASTAEGWEYRLKRASELSVYAKRRWICHPSVRNSRPAYWDGQQAFTSPGEMPPCLFRRIRNLLDSTPIIRKVSDHIIAEMLKAPHTTIGAMLDLGYTSINKLAKRYT
jgi:hypothetical protein